MHLLLYLMREIKKATICSLSDNFKEKWYIIFLDICGILKLIQDLFISTFKSKKLKLKFYKYYTIGAPLHLLKFQLQILFYRHLHRSFPISIAEAGQVSII